MRAGLQEQVSQTGETCSQTLARAVAARDCRCVFGLMGDGNMELFVDLYKQRVDLIQVRHENAAVAMAEGYSWSSGDVGVCSVTHGPGLTQVATSLVAAVRNHSPLVLIVAETPDGYAGAQEFDQARFIASCEVDYRRLDSHEDPAEVFTQAADAALELARPVVLGVKTDVLKAQAGTGLLLTSALPAPARWPSPADNVAAAKALCAELSRARRPIILAGRGARGVQTVALMMELADRFGAGLATTVPAKGVFDGHGSNLGISGGLSHPAAEQVLRQADLVVAVGASLNRSTTRSMQLFGSAEILQLVDDSEKASILGSVRRLFGDAEIALRLARERVPPAGRPAAPWFGDVPKPADAWKQDVADFRVETDPGTLDPRVALAEISTAIPDGATVIISNGHCSGFSATFVDRPPEGEFYAAHGFGAIGQAFTAAVGAALAAPDRKVVCFEGDAGFMMHAQELETAARAGADVTVVVVNDEALGTEYQRLEAEGSEAAVAAVSTPDLAALARVLGARGYRVTELESVASVAREALEPGLSLIDLRTDRAVLSRHMRSPRPS